MSGQFTLFSLNPKHPKTTLRPISSQGMTNMRGNPYIGLKRRWRLSTRRPPASPSQSKPSTQLHPQLRMYFSLALMECLWKWGRWLEVGPWRLMIGVCTHMEKLIESIDQTCFPKDMFLLVSFDWRGHIETPIKWAGMPSAVGGSSNVPTPRPTPTGSCLPQVLKDESPSAHILKYMEGVTKRSLKVTETKLNP